MANIPFLNNAYFAAKVGVGTDSPSTKLMLEHNNDGAVGGTIRIKDRDSQQSANQLTGAIEFESQDATTPTSGVSTAIKAFAASSTGGSYLTISTTDVSTSTLDERMRIDSSGNTTFAGDLTVSGGDITLGGTGRIQGVDTVSASTDAANKAYVDTKLPLSGGTMSGTLTMNGQTISMGNGAITNANNLTFNDPGVNEGVSWNGGNLWQIYESPDAQTNAAGNLQFVQNTTRRLTIDTSGNVQIVSGDLTVSGDSITRSKTRGLGTNYATSEGWVASSGVSSAAGFFGGNFSSNGGNLENKIEYDIGPFGSRELVWMSVPETGNNDDGGWNKSLDGFNNSANNGFMSIIYVRRDAGTASGNFYHGCSGSNTLNLDGTANTNPYFNANGISVLPADVWCVAIGIIYATNDTTTTTSALGGIYRLDTGQKITAATSFRQKTSNTSQEQRVYHYYSTSPTAQLDFTNPGWYILDGSEPTLSKLLGEAAGGGIFVPLAGGSSVGQAMTGTLHGPGATFYVSGNNSTNLKVGDGSFRMEMGRSSIQARVVGASGAASSLNLNPSGGDVLFTGSGNVGIGTTSPSYKLQIGNAGALADSIRIGSYDAVKNTRQYIGYTRQDTGLFETSTSGNTPSSVLAGVSGIRIVNTEGSLVSTKADQSIQLLTHIYDGGSRVALHANYDGNVGIGTTSPLAKLHIKNSSDTQFLLEGENKIALYQDSPWHSYMYFGAYNNNGTEVYGATNRSAWKWFVKHDGDGSPQTMSLYGANQGTAGSAITWNTVGFSQDEDGNVGIGTTSPGTLLEISGNSQASTPALRINCTDSSVQLNQVAGAVQFSVNDASTPGAGVKTSINSIALNSIGSRYGLGFNTTSGVNNVERMRIDDDGNVGIGTTSPGTILHASDVNGAVLRLERKATNVLDGDLLGGIETYRDDDDGAYIQTYIKSYATEQYGRHGYMTFGTNDNNNGNATERMRITSNGNVGIGTNTPTGYTNFTTLAIGNSTQGGVLEFQYAGSQAARIAATGANTLQFATNNAEAMRIDSSGNVGIGTTSPNAKLQVNNQGEGEFAGGNASAAGSSHIMLRDEGGTTRTLMSGPSIVFQTPANADGTNIWATSRLLGSPAAAGSARGTFSIQVRDLYDPLSNGTSWNWRTALTAINTGNVGIGTTSPQAKLHVSGGSSIETTLIVGAEGTGNDKSARVFLNEGEAGVSNSKDYGFSLAYDGQGAQYAGLSANQFGILRHNNSAGGAAVMVMNRANNNTTFTGTVTGTNFILSSDEKLKENIEKACDNRIKADWKTFELKTDKGQKRYGVIAQELEKTNPEFVREDTQGFKSVAYIDLLIAKIAELEARLEKAGI